MQQATKLSIISASFLFLSSSTVLADSVTKLKGNAYISYTSKVQPVLLNQKLRSGQTLTTSENSHVTIQLNKNCRIEVPPLHYVRIKDNQSCPTALPIKGATKSIAKASSPTGTKVTGVGTTKGSSALPLLFVGGAALAVIIHDNRKASPD